MSHTTRVQLARELKRRLVPGPDNAFMSLKHPFITISRVDPGCHAVYNRLLTDRRQRATRAIEAADWWTYVWLHDRLFRPKILRDAASDIPPQQFWTLVAQVWLDSVVIYPNISHWTHIFRLDLSYREKLMQPNEWTALAQLKKTLSGHVRVYRGVTTTQGAMRGLAWTVSRSQAKTFVGDEGWIGSAMVRHDHIQACFTRRGYEELVILPSSLIDLRIKHIR